jgi:translation initiation factor 5B
MRKNKDKRKKKGLTEDSVAGEDPAAPAEVAADDEFALPEKKDKGKAAAAAKADNGEEEEETGGRVKTKAEKEREKKEREKQRKKEQVGSSHPCAVPPGL